MKKTVAALTLGLSLLAPTWAQQLLPAQSQLSFVMKQMGVPVQGQFKQFDAKLQWNAKQHNRSSFALSIDMAHATLGSPQVDHEIPKPEWFFVSQFPKATFESRSFNILSGGRYEVTGVLTIKGVAKTIVVPVALTQTGTSPHFITTATGTVPIQRLSFKIGENEWADTSMVANDVQVQFKLVWSGFNRL